MSVCRRRAPTGSLRGLLACGLLWALAWPAAAEAPPEIERWVPALGISSGALIQKADGTVDSTERGFFNDDNLALFHFMEGIDFPSLPQVTCRSAER